jgi:hypothetical protein
MQFASHCAFYTASTDPCAVLTQQPIATSLICGEAAEILNWVGLGVGFDKASNKPLFNIEYPPFYSGLTVCAKATPQARVIITQLSMGNIYGHDSIGSWWG